MFSMHLVIAVLLLSTEGSRGRLYGKCEYRHPQDSDFFKLSKHVQ